MLSIFYTAARYASNNGEFQAIAAKLSFSLANIRGILTHFSPKIDEFLSSQNISTPSEEQVRQINRLWILSMISQCIMIVIVKCEF